MRNLLCFARGRDGDWEAVCVDFDIAVQGGSFTEVRQALEDAICCYVGAAQAEDAATRAKLLNRLAPLGVRIVWSMRVLWSEWRSRHHGDMSASFPVACPT